MGCNAHCYMCPVHSLTRVKGAMKMDLLELVAAQIDNLPKPPNVVLHFLGEPLMDKKLEQRIKLLKKTKASSVSFSTNSQLLDEKRAISILESGVDYVEFPLESLDKKVFEEIRIGLDFQTVLENITRFIQLRDKMNKATKVMPLFIEQTQNKDERETWVNYFEGLIDRNRGDKMRIFNIHNFGGWIDEETPISSKSCDQLSDMFVILNNGDVPLCCGDPDNKSKMGNIISDGGILGVFNGIKFKSARAMHEGANRRRMNICNSCNIPECSSEFI
ncbi:radical SAM protein [Alphaproteobacteria bacterium]|nr:radical SAM protein [Alphaproteobacteria bacterium]